jgi:hypothetical protein
MRRFGHLRSCRTQGYRLFPAIFLRFGRPERDGFNIPLKGNLAALLSQYRDCG